jgi:excisionase family DNA binding protein
MFSPKNHEPLGSIPEVATYLNVSEVTVRRKIKSGDLASSRFGKNIRIRWADVEALIRSGSAAPRA